MHFIVIWSIMRIFGYLALTVNIILRMKALVIISIISGFIVIKYKNLLVGTPNLF